MKSEFTVNQKFTVESELPLSYRKSTVDQVRSYHKFTVDAIYTVGMLAAKTDRS
jgi:hypothetical protein